jgi:xylulokinase
MGVTLAAGYSLDWIKRLLGSEDSFVTFTKYAEESPIGSLGVTIYVVKDGREIMILP